MLFESLFRKPTNKVEMSFDERILYLRENAAACFCGHLSDTPYNWPGNDRPIISFNSIYVRVGGTVMGYLQQMQIQGGVAEIGHIACDPAYIRKGIMTAIMRAYAREIAARYDATVIVFRQGPPKDDVKGYREFFESLGATELPLAWDRDEGRNDYEWLRAYW